MKKYCFIQILEDLRPLKLKANPSCVCVADGETSFGLPFLLLGKRTSHGHIL